MATLSDLEEVKAALDKGLVSQAEFDDVKRDYLRAKKKALEAKEELQKKELRAKEEALEFQKMELLAKKEALEANKEFQKRKSEADLRAFALESIVKHGSSLMSEEQKVDLVRDYVRMSGLDCDVENEPHSKRQRTSAEERDASLPEPSTPAAAAIPPPADAPTAADEDENCNHSDDDGEDDSDCVELASAKQSRWTEDEDAALVAALRAGQKAYAIQIAGRTGSAADHRLQTAREKGLGSPALREYLEETCPEYVYKGPQKKVCKPWSAEEDHTFIQAHKEGKTYREIAAMLPGRTRNAVESRWRDAKTGKTGTAALLAYAAECRKG